VFREKETQRKKERRWLPSKSGKLRPPPQVADDVHEILTSPFGGSDKILK
jgi:hypothetical protein